MTSVSFSVLISKVRMTTSASQRSLINVKMQSDAAGGWHEGAIRLVLHSIWVSWRLSDAFQRKAACLEEKRQTCIMCEDNWLFTHPPTPPPRFISWWRGGAGELPASEQPSGSLVRRAIAPCSQPPRNHVCHLELGCTRFRMPPGVAENIKANCEGNEADFSISAGETDTLLGFRIPANTEAFQPTDG